MPLRVGSLFSGIGGFDLGLERAGFQVSWQCDSDRFCNQVLAHHWPDVVRFGDVRRLEGRSCSPVDLVVGGFPCQDLSVAGLGTGLGGARSRLWWEFHRLLSELRPACALIENVPGLLSTNEGRDFGILIAGLDELWPGRWGWAVLDSQYFGVAQRRRRLFIVAGPARERIAQVLSLCEGGDWPLAAGGEAQQDVARPLAASTTSYGGQHYDLDLDTYVIQDARPVRDKLQNGLGIEASEVMYTLDGMSQHAVTQALGARRLTPTEYERLQGFPDGWTDLGVPDNWRYKALGNAVTVPVAEYLGLRLAKVL